MAYAKEKQKVSVGDVTGADDALVLTFQVTAEKSALSARERGAVVKGARAALAEMPGIELGYHTKNSSAKAEKAAAKNAEPKPAKRRMKNTEA